MSLRPFVSAFIAVGLLSFAAPSFADVTPPEVTDCDGHEVGESCTLQSVDSSETTAGTCQATTCTSLSYSCDSGAVDSGGEDSDAAPHGGPCGSTTYTCNKCVADGQQADGGKTTTTTPASGDSGGCSASPSDPVGGGLFSMLLAGSVFAGLFVKSKKSKKPA